MQWQNKKYSDYDNNESSNDKCLETQPVDEAEATNENNLASVLENQHTISDHYNIPRIIIIMIYMITHMVLIF